MKWEEIIKAVIIAALSVSGGSYITHSYDDVQHQHAVNDNSMSCSEIIQLVVANDP